MLLRIAFLTLVTSILRAGLYRVMAGLTIIRATSVEAYRPWVIRIGHSQDDTSRVAGSDIVLIYNHSNKGTPLNLAVSTGCEYFRMLQTLESCDLLTRGTAQSYERHGQISP